MIFPTIYIHTSPSGKYYVGITGRKPEIRWGKNGYCYKKQHAHFYNAINKYGWNNFEHEIIASNLTKNEAMKIEILLINKLNSNNNKYGYNITSGGECGNVKPLVPVYQYSLDGKYLKSYKSATDAAREFDCDRAIITRVCKERCNSAYGFMWKHYKVDYINSYTKSTYVKVNQFDYNKNLIKTYNTIAEASKDTGISEDSIVKCCKHKSNRAGDFIWRYINDLPDVYISKNSVIQFDKDKNFITKYQSATECSNKTNIKYYQIKKCYDNKCSYNGFYFIYERDCELSCDGSFLFNERR